MNTHPGLELRGRRGHTPDVKVRKRRAPSESEDLEHLTKKLRHTSNFRELLKVNEDRKRLAQFDVEKGDEDGSLGKRMRLNGDSIVP